MKADQIVAAIRKIPFRPFAILTASGERYQVDHPEQCSISASGRTVGVWLDDEDIAIINAEAITEFVAGPSRRRKPATNED